jgi:hypothetical protein
MDLCRCNFVHHCNGDFSGLGYFGRLDRPANWNLVGDLDDAVRPVGWAAIFTVHDWDSRYFDPGGRIHLSSRGYWTDEYSFQILLTSLDIVRTLNRRMLDLADKIFSLLEEWFAFHMADSLISPGDVHHVVHCDGNGG